MGDPAVDQREDRIGEDVEAFFHHDPAEEGDDHLVVVDADRSPPAHVAAFGIELVPVAGICLGNEALFAKRSDTPQLLAAIARLRAQAPQLPLTTSEPFHLFEAPPGNALLGQLDFLLVNVHPVFQSAARSSAWPGTTAPPATRRPPSSPILVEDAWQGMGLGRQLLPELIELAAARGVRTLTATVQPDNDRVIGLIRRLLPGRLHPRRDVLDVTQPAPRPHPPAANRKEPP